MKARVFFQDGAFTNYEGKRIECSVSEPSGTLIVEVDDTVVDIFNPRYYAGFTLINPEEEESTDD